MSLVKKMMRLQMESPFNPPNTHVHSSAQVSKKLNLGYRLTPVIEDLNDLRLSSAKRLSSKQQVCLDDEVDAPQLGRSRFFGPNDDEVAKDLLSQFNENQGEPNENPPEQLNEQTSEAVPA
jgi:hypothetical protein